MRIYPKTLLTLGITLLCLVLVILAVTELVIGNSYLSLEKEELSLGVHRAVAAIEAQAAFLDMAGANYAAWDDTFYFMQGGKMYYVERNIVPEGLASMQINMILFYDPSEELYYASAVDLNTSEKTELPSSLMEFFASNEMLFSHPYNSTLENHIVGVLNSPEGPLLVSSRPILKTSGEGPVAGTLIVARYLDPLWLEELEATTQLNLTLGTVAANDKASDGEAPSYLSVPEGLNVNYIDEDMVVGSSVLKDINGNPALSIDVTMPRTIYQRGKSSIQFMIYTVLVVGLLFGVVLSFSLERSVLSRLKLLSNNLTDITASKSISSRVNMSGNDELYDLSVNINSMLQTLESEAKVHETLDLMESSLESINAGIMVVDRESRLIMNNKFIKMWNINVELITQNDVSKVLEYIATQTDITEGTAELIQEMENHSKEFSMTLNLKNNSVYDWYVGPLYQEQDVVGTIYCVNDITDSARLQKLEQENRNKLETILSSIISGVILVDPQTHTIVDVNPIAEKIFGQPKEKMIGHFCHKFICPAEIGKCPITDLGSKVDSSERVLINKDGKKVPILKSVVQITFSEKNYLVESFVDLTTIKETEQKLILAKIAAETANRAKSDFLTTMSHELRTPLNSIIGFSDLMIGGSAGEFSDMQKKFLGNIATSGKHLLTLINNILDVSKIEAGKMELNCEPFSVFTTIDEVKQLVSPLAHQKELQLEFTVDEQLEKIYADRLRFKQILFNLTSNAIKFTPKGGKVTISAIKADDKAQFTVRDTGIGISENDMSKLFLPFTQLDSNINRKYEGTGLGLSLVKMFIEMHSGAIRVESEVGKGTAFTFELPLVCNINEKNMTGKNNDVPPTLSSDVPTSKTIPSSSSSESQPSVHRIIQPLHSRGDERLILVVEDDNVSRELLEFTLSNEGYRVVSAKNGKEALELADKMRPFAITLDIMMPGMSGWDVLKQLRDKEKTQEIPVIITSMLDEKDIGVIWGAVEHFTKPIQKDTLIATLRNIQEKMARSSLRVLVVDDEKSAVELVGAMLESEGCHVLKAYGGKEGIDIALRERPDLIVLDLMMPEVSGYHVIEALKAHSETIDIPIIICTAKIPDKADMELLNGNVSGIMTKGMFTKEEILERIKRLQKTNKKTT